MTFRKWKYVSIANFLLCALIVCIDMFTTYLGFARGFVEKGPIVKDLVTLWGNDLVLIMGFSCIFFLGLAIFGLNAILSRASFSLRIKKMMLVFLNVAMLVSSVLRLGRFVIPNIFVLMI